MEAFEKHRAQLRWFRYQSHVNIIVIGILKYYYVLELFKMYRHVDSRGMDSAVAHPTYLHIMYP